MKLSVYIWKNFLIAQSYSFVLYFHFITICFQIKAERNQDAFSYAF